MRERSSKSKRLNQLAIERGISYENFSGSFRRYLDKIRLKYPYQNNQVLVYGNDIFLYNNKDVLITILKVPSKYQKYLRR